MGGPCKVRHLFCQQLPMTGLGASSWAATTDGCRRGAEGWCWLTEAAGARALRCPQRGRPAPEAAVGRDLVARRRILVAAVRRVHALPQRGEARVELGELLGHRRGEVVLLVRVVAHVEEAAVRAAVARHARVRRVPRAPVDERAARPVRRVVERAVVLVAREDLEVADDEALAADEVADARAVRSAGLPRRDRAIAPARSLAGARRTRRGPPRAARSAAPRRAAKSRSRRRAAATRRAVDRGHAGRVGRDRRASAPRGEERRVPVADRDVARDRAAAKCRGHAPPDAHAATRTPP